MFQHVVSQAVIVAAEGTEGGKRLDIETFLWALDKVPLALLGLVLVWITRNAWNHARSKSEKPTMWGKALEGFGNLWGANAVDGQAIMLAVTHVVFYYVDLWYGLPAKLEVAMVLAVSSVFATLLLAATDFDATERFPLWGLTFLASSSFGAILASLFADMVITYQQGLHESVVPSMIWNIAMLILIGICYWMGGAMSRNSRWHRFMAMSPPQSLVVILVAARKNRDHVGANSVIVPFMGLDMEATKDELTKLAHHLPEKVREKLLAKASAAIDAFIDSLDQNAHGGHHGEEEHATHLHPG